MRRPFLFVPAFVLLGWADARAGELSASVEMEAQLFEGDGFAVIDPRLGYESDRMALVLGAPLALRVWDRPPKSDGDYFGLLRGRDWNELSDFGQILRKFRYGAPGESIEIAAGALSYVSLGHGTLVSSYANSLDPNHHPAGLRFRYDPGFVVLEGLASDLLNFEVYTPHERILALRAQFEPFARWGAEAGQLHVGASMVADAKRPYLFPHLMDARLLENSSPGGGTDDAWDDLLGHAPALVSLDADWVALRSTRFSLAAYLDGALDLVGWAAHPISRALFFGLMGDLALGQEGHLAIRVEGRRFSADFPAFGIDAFYAANVAIPLAALDLRSSPASAGYGLKSELRLQTSFLSASMEGQLEGAQGRGAQLALSLPAAGPLSLAGFFSWRKQPIFAWRDQPLERPALWLAVLEARYALNEWCYLLGEGAHLFSDGVPIDRIGLGLGIVAPNTSF